MNSYGIATKWIFYEIWITREKSVLRNIVMKTSPCFDPNCNIFFSTNFAHDTTDALLRHVQKLVAIGWTGLELLPKK